MILQACRHLQQSHGRLDAAGVHDLQSTMPILQTKVAGLFKFNESAVFICVRPVAWPELWNLSYNDQNLVVVMRKRRS